MVENEKYSNEDTEDGEKTEDDNKRKKATIIAVSIIALIALILFLVFFRSSSEPEDEDEGVEETTVSITEGSPQPSVPPVQPSDEPTVEIPDSDLSPGDEGWVPTAAEPRPQEEPPTPLPTTYREEAAANHILPFDVNSGDPYAISMIIATDMFTINPSKTEGGYRAHFEEKMDSYLSDQMRETGFKQWWGNDEPEHTLFYEGLASDPKGLIVNKVELKDHRRIANDIMEYHYVVHPIVVTDAGRTNISDHEIIIQMIGTEDGKWLLNDYIFPNGRVPAIH